MGIRARPRLLYLQPRVSSLHGPSQLPSEARTKNDDGNLRRRSLTLAQLRNKIRKILARPESRTSRDPRNSHQRSPRGHYDSRGLSVLPRLSLESRTTAPIYHRTRGQETVREHRHRTRHNCRLHWRRIKLRRLRLSFHLRQTEG